MKSGLTFLLIILISLSARTQSTSNLLHGKVLFKSKCVRCHGKDGTRENFGAKNLRTSRRSDADLSEIISNGKGLMPTWKKKLNAEQILALMEYVKSLRK